MRACDDSLGQVTYGPLLLPLPSHDYREVFQLSSTLTGQVVDFALTTAVETMQVS